MDSGAAKAAVSVAALLLMGCAARIDELHVEPKLSFEALKRGKIALIPVAAAVRHVTREELRIIDALMYRAFEEHGHGLPAAPFRVVARALQVDPDHWETVHLAINTGKVDALSLYRLSKAVGARYIAFTRVTYSERQSPLTSFETWVERKHSAEDFYYNHNEPRWTLDAVCRARARLRISETLSQDICTTSELVVFSTIVDAVEGETVWDAKHHVQREVGNTKQNPNPSLLAWTLFSELFESLPRPKEK